MNIIISNILIIIVFSFTSGCSSSKTHAIFTFESDNVPIYSTSNINNVYFVGDNKMVLKIDAIESSALSKALFKFKGKYVLLILNGNIISRQYIGTSADPIDALEIHPDSFLAAAKLMKEAGMKLHGSPYDESGDKAEKTKPSIFDLYNKK